MKNRKMVTVSMLMALAILLHFIDSMIPLPVIPGFHLGLANIVGLIALFKYDSKTMISVNIMRVLLGALLNGTLFGYVFILSASGVAVSTLTSMLLFRFSGLSKVGISVGSSVAHCVGQIIAGMFLYGQVMMVAFLPFALLMSVPTGIMTGIIATQVLKRIK